MDFIVISLEPQPFICIDEYGNPRVFKMRQDAERFSRIIKKGLVYPIIDIIPIFDRIKLLSKDRNHSAEFILDELLSLTDEII